MCSSSAKNIVQLRPFGRVLISHLTIFLTLLFAGWTVPLRAARPVRLGGLEELRLNDLRVASVTYRLALANKALCHGAVTPQLGFTLHGIEQYEVADRARVAAGFALGSYTGVMAVVPLSPAEKAGLTADDQIVSVNGRALITGAAGANLPPTRAFVERTQDIILKEMKAGEVTLRVSSAGGLRDVRFAPELGCSSNVELVPGDEVNAWADGQRVVIGAGLLAGCGTDDDLALVIAHELAHNLLGHGHRLAAAGTQGKVMGILGSGLAMMRETEEEADAMAVKMAITAAYDLTQAEAFMSRLLDGRDAASLAATHPTRDRRLALLRAEIAAARGGSPVRQSR